jgi:hypothetical protein
VEVRIASGVNDKLPSCDAIYVNAGATRPVAGWLDALSEGGKLLFPLIRLEGAGVTISLTRPSFRPTPFTWVVADRSLQKLLAIAGSFLAEMRMNKPKPPMSQLPSARTSYGGQDRGRFCCRKGRDRILQVEASGAAPT